MVAGYHLIWTVYGSWLPNDPRGSSSHEIRADWLTDLGEFHHGRKKIQPCGAVIRKFYREAKPKLMHEVYTFTDDEIEFVADAFANTIGTRRYTCYACAIMPDHVHMLIRKHRDQAEEMIGFLQDDSWKRLIDAGVRSSDHPIWGGLGWKVYLDSRADMERIVKYIQDNPIKAGRAPQKWKFVQPYDGWLPGVGARHN